jgi:hypothetical protein
MTIGAEREGGSGGRPRRLTHAETIRRQQRIARLREVERWTFAAIAAEVGMAEKEARETYRRWVDEIAPLMTGVPADTKAAELLRDLDDIRQHQLQIAAHSKNDNARVGALRDAARTIEQEVSMRRALGLMPKVVGDVELAAIADAIVDVLDRHNVDETAKAEIRNVFHHDGGGG